MAKETFSIAAVFWILIPIGLVGGALGIGSQFMKPKKKPLLIP